MPINHNGKYIIRASATDSNGISLTIGFMVDATAYDALKKIHSFQVTEIGNTLHCSDEELYRIQDIIKTNWDLKE